MFQLATDLAANDDALAGPAQEEAHAPAIARKPIGGLGVTDALAGFAPARKSAGGDDGGDEGIETEGEDEADRVEAAVKQGKKAKSVLGAEAEGDEQEAEAEAGAAPAAAVGAKPPARKRLQLKESGSKFSTGMTFSKTGLEKSASYKIWDRDPFHVPIPAVPGLSFIIGPSVIVKAGGGVDWSKKALTANLGVHGSVSAGFAYGNEALAEINSKMTAGASGGFEYSKSPKKWELDGAIKLKTNFSVGVSLGGGIIEYDYEFGACELGTLTGVKWTNSGFDRGALGWEWGDKPKEFFAAIKAGIAKAKKMIDKVKKPIKKVINSGAAAIDAITSW